MPEENLAYSNSKRPQIQDVDEIQSRASIEPDVSLIGSESMRDGFPILTHLQEQRKGRLSAHDPHGRSPSPCSTSSNDDGKGTEVVYDTLSSTSPAKQQPQATSAHSLLSLKSRKSVLCLGASIPFMTFGCVTCLRSITDGGGVRSLTTLLILKDLMRKLAQELAQPNLLPCEVFDMIGGSSCGG
jgi:hypothetical protein